MADCMIDTCGQTVDARYIVEVAIPVRPYKEFRAACTEHLVAVRDIGLRVLDLESAKAVPNAG